MNVKKYKQIIITSVVSVTATIGVFGLIFGGTIRPFLKFHEVRSLLSDKLYYDIDRDKMLDYALTGMTIATDDPYTNYYPKTQFQNFLSSGENSYIGIGIIIGVSENNENLKILSIFKDSPGEKAGLLDGDIILSINGQEVNSDDLQSVSDIIRGEKNQVGTTVLLKIQRGSDVIDVSVDKEIIVKDTVTSREIDENIGLIKINAFDRSVDDTPDTFDEFKEELKALVSKNIRKIVLDLRDNPGGDVEVVAKIADLLLDDGVITYTENKDGKKDYFKSDKNKVDVEIVVLVNEYSASASEILTAALKDRNATKIVGTKTYGKGVVQTIYTLSDGSGISITTSQYFSPNGDSIHKVGITPDYIVQMPDESLSGTDKDVQLNKAIEILK